MEYTLLNPKWREMPGGKCKLYAVTPISKAVQHLLPWVMSNSNVMILRTFCIQLCIITGCLTYCMSVKTVWVFHIVLSISWDSFRTVYGKQPVHSECFVLCVCALYLRVGRATCWLVGHGDVIALSSDDRRAFPHSWYTTTVEALYSVQDKPKCPHQRGVLISEVVQYTSPYSWDCRHCPYQRGVLNSGCPQGGVPLQLHNLVWSLRCFLTVLHLYAQHYSDTVLSNLVTCGNDPIVLILERCPYFRGSLYTSLCTYVAGIVGTVLIREVPLFQKQFVCISMYLGQQALASIQRLLKSECPLLGGSIVTMLSMQWFKTWAQVCYVT